MEYVSQRDSIVRIVGAGNITCTGTLIADDLVLTAHHCLAARDKKGRAQNHDMAPEDIQIELGGDYLPWGEAKVRAIVAPQCGYVSGEGDIAILVLQRHLIGMPTSTVRMESGPEANAVLTIFGFGRCALSSDGIHRRLREADKIKTIEPGQFTAPAAICPGDSGGPVYNHNGDLIGIISASVMHGDETTKDTSIFIRTDAWQQLFSAAHEISQGASPSELPPYAECKTSSPAVAGTQKARSIR
jgi:V8-like Glu-specific endopeptidase